MADKNRYSLRIFDTELLRFELENRGGLEGLVAEIISVHEESRHLLPLDMDCTNEGIVKWLRHRVLPKNRAYADQILQAVGLHRRNLRGILARSMLLSLNDSYWIVPDGISSEFTKYNLYENRF